MRKTVKKSQSRKSGVSVSLQQGLWALLCGMFIATMLCMSPEVRAGVDGSEDPRLGGNRWGAQYFPNIELTTHENEKVRFFDDLIKDKVVVINFIYTTCPDACPLETARMSEVYEILGGRVGQDVFFYSITIDPDVDTPEVLAEYAKRYQVGPGWKFLTGDEQEIILLRKKLGLYIDEVNKDPNDHNLNMIIGNQKTGRWMRRSPFENPYILSNEIGSWLHNYKDKSDNPNSYEDIPDLRNLTKGESLFRTRCAVCHSIGIGDGLARTGPNLKGVTERREPEWLSRWISEPDVMLAEKDSIAMGLFVAYNEIAMPNMQLNPYEVESLIDFIETESRRVAKVESVQALTEQVDAEVPSCCQKEEMVSLDEKDEGTEVADPMTVEFYEEMVLEDAVVEEVSQTVTYPVIEADDFGGMKTISFILGGVFGLMGLALHGRKLR